MHLPPTAEILAAFEIAYSAAPPQPDRNARVPPSVGSADPPSLRSRARLAGLDPPTQRSRTGLVGSDPPSRLSTAKPVGSDPPSQLSTARPIGSDPPSQLSTTRLGRNPLALPLTVASKTIVERTLKEFIGPIAKVICADCFRFAPTLDIAVDVLAKEIPNPEAVLKFRERVQQRLS